MVNLKLWQHLKAAIGYAAVNGYVEPTLLLRCINFGIGESSPFFLFLNMVNLYLVKFEARRRRILNEREFYCFIILFI